MSSAFDDPAALLEHDAFLRALARAVLYDRAAADDAAQDAWLAALRARGAAPLAWRAWLAGVVRNLARQAVRSKARRDRRDAESRDRRPAGVPSASEILDREAARRAVVDAVLALPEPYRSAVLLRWFENLPPREIARRAGVPVETVRTRLKRAHALLRERLDRDYGGRRAGWALALHAFVLPESPVVVATAAAGAFLMTTAVKLVALAACVLLGVVWLLRRDGEDLRTAPSATDALQALNEVAAPIRGGTLLEPGAVASRPFADPADAARGDAAPAARSEAEAFASIEVVLISARDGAPIPDAHVAVESFGAGGVYRTLDLETDRRGVATARVAPGRVVAAEREGARAATVVAAGERAALRLERRPGARVRGRVVGPAGEPVPGATVRSSAPAERAGWTDAATAAGDGAFEIRDVGPGPRNLFAHADGFGPSPVATSADPPADEVVLRLTPGGGGVDGLVVDDDDGRPIARAELRLEVDADDATSPRAAPVAALRTRSDAEGRFRFRGAPLGAVRCWASAPGFAAWRGPLVVDGIAPAVVTMRLVRSATVAGRVLDAAGAPVASAEVRDASGGARRADDRRTWTDASGAFRLEGLAPGAVVLEATAPAAKGRMRTGLSAAPGAVVRRDLILEAAVPLRGRVVDDEGALVGGCVVTVRRATADASPTSVAAIEADGGRFAVDVPDDGPFDVFAADRRAPGRPVAAVRSVAPGRDEIVLRVSATARAAGVVRGTVRDASGAPIEGAEVDARRDGDDATATRADRDGAFEIAAVPPGVVRVAVRAPGFAPRRLEPRRLAPRETWDVGVVVLERPGDVEVAATLDDDVREADVRLRLVAEGGAFDERFQLHGGRGASPPLAAGRYRLHVAGVGVAESWTPVDVRTGVTTRLAVRVRRGREVRVAVRFPAGVAATPVRLHIRAADGTLLAEDYLRPDDGRLLSATFGLPAGTYRATAEADALSAAASVVVPPNADAPPVALELR
ncbi:MAG TPA: sigma-70 family RNA polymerase sigma factor [Planctomycetota bacterium]|nr:sigma-70 family RNA polymerase sigma factor [Planctomycetota bacterium]